MKNILFSAMVLLLLGGCSARNAVNPEHEMAADKGVIVASVSKIGRGNVDAWFCYEKEGDEYGSRMQAIGTWLLFEPDDFPDDNRTGRLQAFEAEAGQYFLTDWCVFENGAYFTRLSRLKVPPQPLPFTVKAGAVTYLGNLHVDVIDGRNIFGLPISIGGVLKIENRYEEDMKLLQEKYPNLANWPVVVDIPDATAWPTVILPRKKSEEE